MKLQFLGQSYNATNITVETSTTEINARFLGRNYTLRRPIAPQNQASGQRTYRGVAY